MSKLEAKKYPEVKEIKQDLESLKDNSVELAQHVKNDAVYKIEETTSSVKAQAKAELKKVEKHVEANPIQSVAIAFAGGVLLSMLMGRR